MSSGLSFWTRFFAGGPIRLEALNAKVRTPAQGSRGDVTQSGVIAKKLEEGSHVRGHAPVEDGETVEGLCRIFNGKLDGHRAFLLARVVDGADGTVLAEGVHGEPVLDNSSPFTVEPVVAGMSTKW